jgi:hypothetical protein
MHESNPPSLAGTPGLGNNYYLSALESTYRRHGHGIYTFCLRLLANEKAAESATVDVFVEFNKDVASQPDESRTLLRLRALAINASMARLNARGRMTSRRLAQSLRRTLHRLWGRRVNKEVHK